MMAVAPNKDRAVVTSSRNFFRTMGWSPCQMRYRLADTDPGGAFGLAIANALYNNQVHARLPDTITPEEAAEITQSSLAVLEKLDEATRAGVIVAYADGLRSCFILFTAGSGLCFLLAWFIKEVKFRPDPLGLSEGSQSSLKAEEKPLGQAPKV